MTPQQIELIHAWSVAELAYEDLRDRFPASVLDDVEFVTDTVRSAVQKATQPEFDTAIQLMMLSKGATYLDLKNELLTTPGHTCHQEIAKDLQDLADPSTVPFVRHALGMGFRHLEYTASEPGVIAKWFSWLLFAIGTDEALETLVEFSAAPDQDVAAEMQYRLSKAR